MRTLLLTIILPAVASAAMNRAHIAAHVIDAIDSRPIEGAKLVASFEDDIGWRAWNESPKPDIARGVTDANGNCRLSGRTNCGSSSCWIDKAPVGYYKPPRGGGIIKYEGKSLFGTWQPENVVVTLSLQRVEHPIPLYVRNVETRDKNGRLGGFDGTNAVLKFDFIVGDWLPPLGNGKQADMIIRTEYKYIDSVKVLRNRPPLVFYDFISEVEFVGEGNGLCEADLSEKNLGIKFRTAPNAGYVHKKTLRFGSHKQVSGAAIYAKKYTESMEGRCYCFRIRSKFNENGELVEAYYGKVYGDFNFEGWDKIGFCGMEFLCYLNPKSLDRNLEWDMKNNLCPNPGNVRNEP